MAADIPGRQRTPHPLPPAGGQSTHAMRRSHGVGVTASQAVCSSVRSLEEEDNALILGFRKLGRQSLKLKGQPTTNTNRESGSSSGPPLKRKLYTFPVLIQGLFLQVQRGQACQIGKDVEC